MDHCKQRLKDGNKAVHSIFFRMLVHFTVFTVTLYPLFAALGIENLYERALYIRKILLTIPRSVLIVMRYLFAFLNQ